MFTEGRRNLARGALGLFAAGAALLASREEAKAQTVDDLIRKGKLTIAIDTTTAPYASLDQSMQPQGYDIDLARMIAKSLKTDIEFVTVNSPGRIPALLTNRVDMVVSIFSITPERAQQIAFSMPYGGQSSPKMAAVSASSANSQGVVSARCRRRANQRRLDAVNAVIKLVTIHGARSTTSRRSLSR